MEAGLGLVDLPLDLLGEDGIPSRIWPKDHWSMDKYIGGGRGRGGGGGPFSL